MILELSEDQEELQRTVRRFLREKSPEGKVRADMASDLGFDRDLWRLMAQQLGLQGLTIPERFGGSGAGFVESFIVLEEMGRSLFCSPYFSTVALAASTVMRAGDERVAARLLPAIASGAATATVAVAGPDGVWDLPAPSIEARLVGEGWVLSGTEPFVLDGATADHILVRGSTSDGTRLFEVAGDAVGLTKTPLITLDQTRRIAGLDFDSVAAHVIESRDSAQEVLRWVMDRAIVAQAAEQVGAASACLESTVDYAKERHQFGRPIGSFQAIKHKCAEMLIALESARSTAHYACLLLATEDDQSGLAASLAKACCSDAFLKIAAEHIQVHGGIGFTWEHSAHLYFKRAKSAQQLFGAPGFHRDRVAELIGI
ncbi:Acyl-CoA dehydrogenase [Frankia canadensis]|uniref:Acyl-CoA dehydrogenase n=1 Tax=Frankia canadensis TaxID=1836972 RepID=A0A2I2KHW4_9ACTN|nr:acyl-CoA dehydrogenase family protein [Frankia canadensis]SNQ45260.1 Acyl-CoA dehydrogenase [Frankia canadensis]SOU52550.1 Acyl-CoA dehydrogenase [Frankia canadensis]